MAKYYKSGTKRANLHKKIYDKLISLGYSSDKAYEIATKVTNWA